MGHDIDLFMETYDDNSNKWIHRQLEGKYITEWNPDAVYVGRNYLFFDMLGYYDNIINYATRTYGKGLSGADIKIIPRVTKFFPDLVSHTVQKHYYMFNGVLEHGASIMTAAEFENTKFWNNKLMHIVNSNKYNLENYLDREFISDHAENQYEFCSIYKDYNKNMYSTMETCIKLCMSKYGITNKSKIRFVYWFD